MNYEFINVAKLSGTKVLDNYGTLGFSAKDCGHSTLAEGKNIVILSKDKYGRCEAIINGFTLCVGSFHYVNHALKIEYPNLEIVDCFNEN